MIMATHDMRLGLTHCDRIVILSHGRVSYNGRPGDTDLEALQELYDLHAGDRGISP